MSSLVKVNRVLPLVFPEIFPATADSRSSKAGAEQGGLALTAEEPQDLAEAIHAKRLKSLYQRTLRNQGHSESLTYSGRLSA